MPASPRASPASAQTPMAFVQAVLLAYARRSMSPDAVLRKAQITPQELSQADRRVTAAQFERLCAAAMQELDDEAPGWFSRRLPWGSYGLLARASISAPTVGLALARWCRHHGLLTGDVRLTLTTAGNQARVEITEHRDLGALREFALLSLLRNLHGLACWWVDAHVAPRLTQFPFAAPAYADVVARLFPGPLRFDAASAALAFDAHWLDAPLRRDGAALDQMLRRALPIMVWPYRREQALAPRVRQLLQQPRTAHTADSLAALLSLSARTLHRQLQGEGTSLQTLKNEVRQARATELLLRTPWPLARVARAVGFDNDKSFIRAYRGWTGVTPQALRRAGAEAPPG